MKTLNLFSFLQYQFLKRLEKLYLESLKKWQNESSIVLSSCSFCFDSIQGIETYNKSLSGSDITIEDYQSDNTPYRCQVCLVDKQICDFSKNANLDEQSSCLVEKISNIQVPRQKDPTDCIPEGNIRVWHVGKHDLYRELIRKLHKNLYKIRYELTEYPFKLSIFYNKILRC